MRRRVLVVALVGLLGLNVFLWEFARSPVPGVYYGAIEPGMSREAVEALLGGPGNAGCFWPGLTGTVWVAFDADGRVVSKRFFPVDRKTPLLLDRLRDLLPW